MGDTKNGNSLRELSSEERLISFYLEDLNIQYKVQEAVIDLYGDDKKYRVADFYLPKLGVYLEYFGQYNASKKKREEYDKKATVYIQNNIPTIFIYPHELGIFEYALHEKLLKLFKIEKFKLIKEAARYRRKLFFEDFGDSSSFLLLSSVVMLPVLFAMPTGLSFEFRVYLIFLFLIIFLITFYFFVRDFWHYIVKKRY